MPEVRHPLSYDASSDATRHGRFVARVLALGAAVIIPHHGLRVLAHYGDLLSVSSFFQVLQLKTTTGPFYLDLASDCLRMLTFPASLLVLLSFAFTRRIWTALAILPGLAATAQALECVSLIYQHVWFPYLLSMLGECLLSLLLCLIFASRSFRYLANT